MSDEHRVYMEMSKTMSTLSKAKRKKVGAVLLSRNGVALVGVNGTPSGWDNICEDSEGNTKPEVLHAELNCILKAAKEGVSVIDGTLYVTLSPCIQCSSMIVQAGIKNVYFNEPYRCLQGLKFLLDNKINVYWCCDESTVNAEKGLDEIAQYIQQIQK